MTTTLTARSSRYLWDDGKYRFAPEPETLTITGSGFGTAPTVAIYELWGAATVGAVNQAPWDSGSYATGLWPEVFAGHDGVNGIGIREGGTNAATNNRLTGFEHVLPAHDSFFTAFSMCIPSGRHFSGAAATETLPPASNLKMDWSSDTALDPSDKADIVTMTRLNSGEWGTQGNTGPGPVYFPGSANLLGNKIDFDKWMYFSGGIVAGSPDPFVDNGITTQVITNSNGTFTNQKTDAPVFAAPATAAQFTHINFPGWSGNNDQDLTQHLFSYYYRATGANCNKRVELGDNATYANCTKRLVIKHTSWSDTSVSVAAQAWQKSGMTHKFVIDGTTILASGAI